MKSIHEIVVEVMADKNHPTELKVFNQPVEEDLIRKLYELKDRHPLYNTCLIGLIESKVLVHSIVENLLAAKQLLDEAGIDFHCIVEVNDEPDDEL